LTRPLDPRSTLRRHVDTPTAPVSDLLIIGGGVMGRFTAYHAAERSASVVVLERGRIGDPMTASYSRTRSFRNDYLDATYARLAHEAFDLWGDFERRTGAKVLVRCGCLNIGKRSVTPDLARSYAELSFETLTRLRLKTESFDSEALRRRFSYLDADVAHLDVDAGVVDVPAVNDALTRALAERGVRTLEGVETIAIEPDGDAYRVITDAGEFLARSLVVAAGHGTNDVLGALPGCELRAPITKDRPSEAKYFFPSADTRRQFTADVMPVIAYLDAGIYCHPIVEGVVDAVKIGYYHPPDMPGDRAALDGIADFIEQCMPGLRTATARDVDDVDQCDYDLVADDDFVLGPIPGFDRAFVGVGWRGTGYKFAPWIGRVLAGCALQGGTVYDIGRFDPARFAKSAAVL
jgi:glycine/D-amino acid oxidase-like deaminating enzyme